ncbi:helix-turn-helix domain-containing protein [Blautia wexlerae]|uniref:Helix-turn-helix domain-containing protein n=1 Tax=Blautia wexlerae TaxID=418240 RepID=A0A6L8T9A5_9FIRM|nr:helix-turn-helix domain-containing protein [Blautia wexlerae]MZT17584.1 helix-turn-helix domain-containing protein [Blautia wexlerae]MZT35732.1 helix-turn-helix domain-containing protein [Blautia wexlerae]MZT43624.1 helix-turn-helix domain-containing protein [Blautia wexlerae]MZT47750.1 helix-turn-helix domain-containing protein [Blautia wexlerae]
MTNGFIKNRRRHQRQKKNWQRSIKQIMNGTRNPSLSIVKKLAQGLGMQLKLEFVLMPTKNKM